MQNNPLSSNRRSSLSRLPHPASMQAARAVENANQQKVKEAEAAHQKNLATIRAANEVKKAQARKEWDKECQVAREHHERLTAVIREEFEAENEAKRRTNDVLLENQRAKWLEAVRSTGSSTGPPALRIQHSTCPLRLMYVA
jgi:uncharacterized membrane protein YqiK